MKKVRELSRVKDQPQKDAIAALEYMLEKAKRGEVYSVVILAENRDGHMDRSHSIDFRNVLRIVGGLERLKLYFLDKFCESVENGDA